MNKQTRKSSRIKSSSNAIPKESSVDSCQSLKGTSKEPETGVITTNKRRKTKEPSEGPLINSSNLIDSKSSSKRDTAPPEEISSNITRRSTRRRDALEAAELKQKCLSESTSNGNSIKYFDYETLVDMFDVKSTSSKPTSKYTGDEILTVKTSEETFKMTRNEFYKIDICDSTIINNSLKTNDKINGDVIAEESITNGDKSNEECGAEEKDNNCKIESVACTSLSTSIETNDKASTSLDITNCDETTPINNIEEDISPSISKISPASSKDNISLNVEVIESENTECQPSESQKEDDILVKSEDDTLSVIVDNSDVMEVDESSRSIINDEEKFVTPNQSQNDFQNVEDDNEVILPKKETTPMEVDETNEEEKFASPINNLKILSPIKSVESPVKSPNKLSTPTKLPSTPKQLTPSKPTSPVKQPSQSPNKQTSNSQNTLTNRKEFVESPKTVEVSSQKEEHINGQVKAPVVGPTEALNIIINDNTGSGTSTAPNSSIPSDILSQQQPHSSNIEVVKSESSVYKRVKQLKEQGLWSQTRLPQVEEPKPQVIHWDLLLEEMAWMWSDFVRERKMKKQNRKHIGRAIKKMYSKMESKEEEEERAQRIRAEKMANKVAREIKKFWEGAAKLVDMKEQLILNKKRQEIRKKNMDKIVDQANIFSTQVGQTLQRGGSMDSDDDLDIYEDEDNYNNTLYDNKELDELDALVKSQNAPLADLIEELPPEYLAHVQGMTSNYSEHNDNTLEDIAAPVKRRKIEEIEDDVTMSSSGDAMEEDNSNTVPPELSKGKISDFEKMREECQTLQPQGFTLETAHINVEQPSMIRGVLREYQLLGLNWLYTLFKRHVNGILADEMGLGKTLQTISLLAYLVEKERIWRPHLIIVPTSVILNWDMEFKKWCPNFKTLVYHGPASRRNELRKGWTKDDSFDVVITSYKIITNDIKAFRKRKWQYLILDEAHTIKNFKTQAWQKLVSLKSMNRLLLTGTPLQNDLMELHSLLKFLMPTIFTSQSDFKEVFNDPLVDFAGGAGDSNPELVGKLHDILRPFLLRRLKKDVEKQLPTKKEVVVRCSLAKRQRSLYDDFICRRDVQQSLASGSIFNVLNITMQLRKVCNHPNLHETRSVESPVVLFVIKVFYPACVFDIVQPAVDEKIRNLPTGLIFNGGRLYSVRALNCLRSLKCSRQEYMKMISSKNNVSLPKLKGFKLNFHNFISTKIYNREDLKSGQRIFDVDMKNMESLNLKIGDDFVLSFDDEEVDRIPLMIKDKKPLLCKLNLDNESKKPGIYVSNCNDIVYPNNFQELQFLRNPRNDFILIRKGEAEARKLRLRGIDHKNFSSVVQLPKTYSTKALLNFRAVSTNYSDKRSNIQGSFNKGNTVKKEIPQENNDVEMIEANEIVDKEFKTPEYFSYLKNLNPEDFVDKTAREKQLLEKEENAEFISNLSIERIGNMRDPLIYEESVHLFEKEFIEDITLSDHSILFNWLDYNTSVEKYNKRFLEDLLDGCIDKFDIYTHPAISKGIQAIPVGRGRNFESVNEMDRFEEDGKIIYDNLDEYYHKLSTSSMFTFPELRLIEYDCGKLQRLTIMLRELFTQGHRVLIFTQMSSMLDILQEFLSYHGYKYFRLDGSTALEQRQAMMEQFNNDDKIFCFILSTRSGGIGINLTGADTVIFYDSDWNPTMDAQAQDRCHRIGQTKDVTIYRLISECTIEETILERAMMKRRLGEMAIDNAKFTPDYFKDMTIRDLFKDNIKNLDKDIIEAKVEAASETDIRKALAANEDTIDANAALLAEKEATTDSDEILGNTHGYDDQEINEELKPFVDSLTNVEKFAVRYLEQLNDQDLQKRLEEIELNDQLLDIDTCNDRKESIEGFDEVPSKKNRKRINPNNVLPSRASERISRVALNKIIEAEDREAFAKVKQICRISDKPSKKSNISNSSKVKGKKIDNRRSVVKKERKISIKKKKNNKNPKSNKIDIVVEEDSSIKSDSLTTKTPISNISINSSNTYNSPPIHPLSKNISHISSNFIPPTPQKSIVKSSTLVNSNFIGQNTSFNKNNFTSKLNFDQNGGRVYSAKLSKNVSTVIKPPRKCYNTLPISRTPTRQPIFRNTTVSVTSTQPTSTISSSNFNNKPSDVKRVVYICVKNNQPMNGNTIPKVSTTLPSTQKIVTNNIAPSLPPSRNFSISRPDPRPITSLRITNNTTMTQRIPISNNARIFTIQNNNTDKDTVTSSNS
uniref:Helicase ATP-binding domain-containing protein n=1 Tax=Parastrongyloides trichosuri TaxID=131310 RepID=A0A0N4Z1Y8_PARTI